MEISEFLKGEKFVDYFKNFAVARRKETSANNN